MYKRYCNNKYQRLFNPCCCIVNKQIIKKIIINNNKCLNSPNHSLSDPSSLPESENIPSNSSFVSKKILYVIFFLIKSIKFFLFYLANRKYEKRRIYRKRLHLDQRESRCLDKRKSWFRRQKPAVSENVYRIKIA